MTEQNASKLEELVKYQYAELANAKAKNDPYIALTAMGKFYSKCGLENDPIIQSAMARGSVGISKGYGISDEGIIKAIEVYSDLYQKARENSTVGAILDSIKLSGYTSIPKQLEKYANITLKELVEKAKNKDNKDEDAVRAIMAINLLERQKLEGQIYSSLIKEGTDNSLKTLYEEKAETKAKDKTEDTKSE